MLSPFQVFFFRQYETLCITKLGFDEKFIKKIIIKICKNKLVNKEKFLPEFKDIFQ